MRAPGASGSASPRRARPALGLGERETPSSGTAGLLRSPAAAGGGAAASAHRPEERGGPAAVPARGAAAGKERGAHGDGRAPPPARCLPAAPQVAPCRGKGRAGRGRPVAASRGSGRRSVSAASGSVAVRAGGGGCEGAGVPGQPPRSAPAPLSRPVRSAGGYYVTCGRCLKLPLICWNPGSSRTLFPL